MEYAGKFHLNFINQIYFLKCTSTRKCKVILRAMLANDLSNLEMPVNTSTPMLLLVERMFLECWTWHCLISRLNFWRINFIFIMKDWQRHSEWFSCVCVLSMLNKIVRMSAHVALKFYLPTHCLEISWTRPVYVTWPVKKGLIVFLNIQVWLFITPDLQRLLPCNCTHS